MVKVYKLMFIEDLVRIQIWIHEKYKYIIKKISTPGYKIKLVIIYSYLII